MIRLAVLVASSGCARPAPLTAEPLGADSARAAAALETTTASDPHWDLRAELATLRPATKRSPSGHFTGEHDGDVLANETAAPYPALGPWRGMTAGATLVERQFTRGGSTPTAYLVMVKRAAGYDPPGDDWEYLVVTPAGRVEHRGRLAMCARCHAEAPHAHLFGGR